MPRWTKRKREARSRQYPKGQQVAPQAQGPLMARFGNSNPVTHGLGSVVVREYRRLNRIHRADPNNLEKLEAVETARVLAVNYVENLLAEGIENPDTRIKAMDFVIQQTKQATRRIEANPFMKGADRWRV